MADLMCQICMCILWRPVKLPCHCCALCQECLQNMLDKSPQSQCPICRKNLRSWVRSTYKKGSLIDLELQNRVQKERPDFYQRKLQKEQHAKDNSASEGDKETNDDDDDFDGCVDMKIVRCLSEQGEVKKDYEKNLAKWEKEMEEKREEDERQLRQLLESEEQERKNTQKIQEQQMQDSLNLAKQLEEADKNEKIQEQQMQDSLNLAKQLEEADKKEANDRKYAQEKTDADLALKIFKKLQRERENAEKDNEASTHAATQKRKTDFVGRSNPSIKRKKVPLQQQLSFGRENNSTSFESSGTGD